MKEKEVAIIGGGLAGLTCAYYLSRQNIKTSIFEKSHMLGGRVPKALRITSAEDESILQLAEDLGINDQVQKVSLKEFGAYNQGKITPFSQFTPFLVPKDQLSVSQKILRSVFARFMGIDLDALDRLHKELKEVNSDPSRQWTEKENELHKISTQEWMEKYPESIVKNIIFPMLQITYSNDFQNMSAKRGTCPVNTFCTIAQKGGYEITKGPLGITTAIKKELIRKGPGTKIHTISEVKKVEPEREKIAVTYEKHQEQETEEFDYAVLATPLKTSEDILGRQFGIDYTQTKFLVVEGRQKDPKKILIGADPDYNMRTLYKVGMGNTEYVYLRHMDEDLDLSNIYEEHSVMGEQTITAMPFIRPNQDIPDLKQDNNIFLCGDFYYCVCCLNTSVYTGMRVADMINKEIHEANE